MPSNMIIDKLKAFYGIEVSALEPLSFGADIHASLYKVRAKNKKTYFLKLKQQSINVDLLNVLANFEEIIQPVKTIEGKLSQQVESLTFILYPFIEGEDGFSRALSNEQWIRLGKVLRRIHQIELPSSFDIRREDYSPKWRDAVRSLLNQRNNSSFLQFLQANKSLVERIVDRADFFSKNIKRQKSVFCHSDIHGGNVLLDGDSLYIVDWDDPILAPKERDLMFIGGGVANVWNKPDEIKLFYQGYGQVEIDRDLLSYYRYERIVQDIAEFAQLFLHNDTSSKDSEIMYKHFLDMFAPKGVIDIAIATDPSSS